MGRGRLTPWRNLEASVALEPLIIFVVVGAIAGWLAGVVVRGYGLGLGGNIAVGVLGAVLGGLLFAHFHWVHGRGLVGDVIGATVGAIVLLLVIRLFRRRTFLQRMFQRRI
jgi:uncharacterized membrane protein YeaQ/YmgE (transglycosylase-associated protein family)